MTVIYIDISEQKDIDYAVMVACHREAKKIIFIGHSPAGERAAKNLRVEFEQLPAEFKVPMGELRIFAGNLAVAY